MVGTLFKTQFKIMLVGCRPGGPLFRTCPSAVRDLLMAAASTSRWPSASVFEIRSEPARSHKVSVPRVVSPDTWSEPSTSSATTR